MCQQPIVRVSQELGPEALCPYDNSPVGHCHVGANVEISCDALPADLSEVSVKPAVKNSTPIESRITLFPQMDRSF